MKDTVLDSVVRPGKLLAPPKRTSLYQTVFKRAFDVLFVLLISPIVAPVVAVLWLIVRLDGGPGFFGHLRVGRDGRTFKCWKLRTMVVDAEQHLQDFLRANPDAAAEWAKFQKLEQDPRITWIGNFLRVTSLDEVPQFWNVLMGEMSVVGPRPFAADQKSLYDLATAHGSYYRFRPGVTGLWQVSSRNESKFTDRVRFDELYARICSVRTDIAIILRTIAVVLMSRGK